MVLECDIDKLTEARITPTAFCYMYYILKGLEFPYRMEIGVLKYLEEEGWLKIQPNGEVILRQKFTDFIKEREDLLNVSTWIDEYHSLFPKGIYNNGRPVRASKSVCLNKMIKFIKANKKITKEDIIEATRMYILGKERDGWKYTTCSDNFISKDGNSILLSLIEDTHARESYRNNLEAGGSVFHKQI